MKKLALLTFVSTLAWASLPDRIAKIYDIEREGDLSTKALAFYKASADPLKNSCGTDFNQEAAAPEYKIIRLESSSSAVTPHTGKTPFELVSAYMVVKYCFGGATHSGAERMISDAAVVQASRYGYLGKKGQIVPSRADTFKKLRDLDKTQFGLEY